VYKCDYSEAHGTTISLPSAERGSDPNSNRVYFHDVSGDGLADMIVARHEALEVFLNVGGATWNGAYELLPLNLPAYGWGGDMKNPNWGLAFADMNASGTDDIVYIGETVYYLDFAQRVPRLLTHFENGLGASANIEYQSASQIAVVNDPAKGLPQPIQVVTSIRQSNALVESPREVNATVWYAYRDPVYDARERRFRGFQHVTTTRSAAGTPTSKTETSFLLGAVRSNSVEAARHRSTTRTSRTEPCRSSARRWMRRAVPICRRRTRATRSDGCCPALTAGMSGSCTPRLATPTSTTHRDPLPAQRGTFWSTWTLRTIRSCVRLRW
jgi:Insecticide toxin TcdB middle/N-terminal region